MDSLILWQGRALSHRHALRHRFLVHFTIVIDLLHALGACLTFEVQERCIVIGDALVVLHVAKDVEQLLVKVLCVLDLIGLVVGKITVSAALSWLVSLILLRTHCHDIFNPLLNHSAVDVINAKDELEQFAKLFLRVGENILKPEEVDRLISVLGNVDPVLEP